MTPHGDPLTELLTTLSVPALLAVLERSADQLKVRVAEHVDLPAPVRSHLSADPSAEVREAVGSSPACEASVLAELMLDADRAVVRRAAVHRNTPEAALLDGCEGDADVRTLIAERPDLHETVALRLARDPDLTVRVTLARNTNATRHESVATALSRDGDSAVRRAVLDDPALPGRLLRPIVERGTDEDAAAAAAHPNCPARLLADLAHHTSPAVRLAVARDGLAPWENTLWSLAETGSSEVAVALLERHGRGRDPLPVDVAFRLAIDPRVAVAKVARSMLSSHPTVGTWVGNLDVGRRQRWVLEWKGVSYRVLLALLDVGLPETVAAMARDERVPQDLRVMAGLGRMAKLPSTG